jgi:hypothetical protein
MMFLYKGKSFISVSEAAKSTNIPYSEIIKQIEKGEIKTELVFGVRSITADGYESLKTQMKRAPPVIKVTNNMVYREFSQTGVATGIKFDTARGYALVDGLKTIAKLLNKPMKEIAYDLIEEGISKRAHVLEEYETIESRKNNLISSLKGVN